MITCTTYVATNGPFSRHARSTTSTGLEAGDAADDVEDKKSYEDTASQN
jgi:hypothetical protein